MRSVLFTLFAVSGLLASSMPVLKAAEPGVPEYAAVLTVKRMCCAKESVPAIKELNKLPGVARVVANHKARTLTIVPTEELHPSPRAMWEVAERLKIDPVRLSTVHGVFEGKPQR